MNDAVINRWLRQSAQALRRDRPNDAVQCCQRILAAHPNEPAALNNLAQAYLAMEDLALAEAALLQCLAVEPDYSLAHGSLAEVYLAQARAAYRAGDMAQAQERAERLVEDYPDSPTAAEARLIVGFVGTNWNPSAFLQNAVREASISDISRPPQEPQGPNLLPGMPSGAITRTHRYRARWWHYVVLFAIPLAIAGVAIIRNGVSASFSAAPPLQSLTPKTRSSSHPVSMSAAEFFPFDSRQLLVGQVSSAPHGHLIVYHELDAGTFHRHLIIAVITIPMVAIHGIQWLIPTTGSLYVLSPRGVTGGQALSGWIVGKPSSAHAFAEAQRLLVLPIQVYIGEHWTSRSGNTSYDNRVVGEPDLTLPIGTVRTVEVLSRQVSSTGTLSTTTWYGLGLGPVQSFSRMSGAAIPTTTWSISHHFSLIAKLSTLKASGFPVYHAIK